MKRLFAVIRTHGPAYDGSLALEDQEGWAAHAEYMDRLVDEGTVTLGGPLEGSADVLLILRAEGREEVTEYLAADPWTRDGLLVTTQTWPWQLRLGAVG